MLSKTKLTEILNELGANFTLDQDNICSFIVKDKHTIKIEFDEDNLNTYIYGTIGELPSNIELQLLVTEEIASANFMWNETLWNTLSMDPESDDIVYQSYYTEASDFKTYLVDFVEKFEFWCERYKEIVSQAEKKLAETQNTQQDTEYEHIQDNTNLLAIE